MVKLIVIYGHPKDPEAFETYYAGPHLLFSEKMKAVKRFEFTKCLGTADGGPPAHYCMAELHYDLPNFATGGVDVTIGSV